MWSHLDSSQMTQAEKIIGEPVGNFFPFILVYGTY